MTNPILSLIYKTIEKEYNEDWFGSKGIILDENVLIIRNLNLCITLAIDSNYLGFYLTTAIVGDENSFRATEKRCISILNIISLEIENFVNSSWFAKDYLKFIYKIKEIIKPNSIKFIEDL